MPDYKLDNDEWKHLCGPPQDGQARLSNVLLTMLQRMEVPVTSFVDSTGPITDIVA